MSYVTELIFDPAAPLDVGRLWECEGSVFQAMAVHRRMIDSGQGIGTQPILKPSYAPDDVTVVLMDLSAVGATADPPMFPVNGAELMALYTEKHHAWRRD